MTITLTGANGLFTILKRAITASETCVTHHGTTTPGNVDLVLGEMSDADTVDAASYINGLAAATRSYRDQTALPSALKSFAQSLLLERVTADAPQIQEVASDCLDELIRQMKASASTVERNVPAATVTPPASEAPTLAVSLIDPFGGIVEAAVDETLVGTASSATTLSLVSGNAQRNTLAWDWPTGSQTRTTLSVQTSGVLLNQSFDEEDDRANAPDDWIVETGVVGTTVAITNPEVQTITLGGTPTSGQWWISHTRASDSYKQTTRPLAYNAGASEVQAALAEFVGFADVSVTYATGVWTVNFNSVSPAGNQNMLTTTNTFDTGTLTVAEGTAGQDAIEYKALAILGTSASETTTLRQRGHSLNLRPNTVYAVSVLAKRIAATTGTLNIELVDGTGTAITNDAGTAQRIAIDIATMSNSAFGAHTGFFQLPKTLPAVWYIQLRLSADLADTKGFYLDDLIMSPAVPLYTDGPYAALLANRRDLIPAERYTIAVSNTWAGKVQTWFYRWFGRLLPSAASGAETITDP